MSTLTRAIVRLEGRIQYLRSLPATQVDNELKSELAALEIVLLWVKARR